MFVKEVECVICSGIPSYIFLLCFVCIYNEESIAFLLLLDLYHLFELCCK